jgi:hypothetical protein
MLCTSMLQLLIPQLFRPVPPKGDYIRVSRKCNATKGVDPFREKKGGGCDGMKTNSMAFPPRTPKGD